jgi:hypothetical protein
LDVEITVRTEDKIIDDIHSDLHPISWSQAGTIGGFIVPLVSDEGQQCRLVATTQANPDGGVNRGVKVGQVPYFIRIEEEQAMKSVISPICKALEDWMIRIAGTVESHKAKSMIKDRISGLHNRYRGLDSRDWRWRSRCRRWHGRCRGEYHRSRRGRYSRSRWYWCLCRSCWVRLHVSKWYRGDRRSRSSRRVVGWCTGVLGAGF